MKSVYLIALLLLTPSQLAFAQRRVESTPRPKSEEIAGVINPAPLLDISITSSSMGRISKQPLYFRLRVVDSNMRCGRRLIPTLVT